MWYQYQLRLLLQRDGNAVFILQTTGTFATRTGREHLLAGRWDNVEVGAGSDLVGVLWSLRTLRITGSSLNDRILAQACAPQMATISAPQDGVVQDEDEHEIVKETGEGSEYQN
jgi:hypothetical protein